MTILTSDFQTASTWARWRNTHLHLPLTAFNRVISDEDYDSLLSGRNASRRSLPRKVAQRLLWFWPRIDGASGWAEADLDKAWTPAHYVRSEHSRLVAKIIDEVPISASLMELGCNRGTDMNFLYLAGYRNFKGVDVSGAGLREFALAYPKTWACADIQHDLFQRYLMNQASKSVEFIYSNGATIELVHPSFPIVKEICRVARIGVLLELHLTGHIPRDYLWQFKRNGFSVKYSSQPEDAVDDSHLIYFARD